MANEYVYLGKEGTKEFYRRIKNLPQRQVNTIYLSPYGDDANDGFTKETPVNTLAKALSITRKIPNSLIYILYGGNFNLNGAETLGIAAKDGDTYEANVDINIRSSDYLSFNFKDGEHFIHINGNVSIVSDVNLTIYDADIEGERFYVESFTEFVNINNTYKASSSSSYTKYPGIKSKSITVRAATGISAKYLDMYNTSGIAEFTTKASSVNLHYADITLKKLSITGQNIYGSNGTEVYLVQDTSTNITVSEEFSVLCRDLYADRNLITCGNANIKGHYIKTPSIKAKGDVIIDSDYEVILYGDIYSDSGNIVINAESDYLQIQMNTYRRLNPDRYLKARGVIKINASYIFGTMPYGFEAGKVIINLIGYNSSTLPDIYAETVDIKSNNTDTQITNIFPKSSSGTLSIRCNNLSTSSQCTIGVNSGYYFKKIDINAANFISRTALNLVGYSVNIKTNELSKGSSGGDFTLENASMLSAMCLNIDCLRMKVDSGSRIMVGANKKANDKIANLDWENNDVGSNNLYSTVINAASIRFTYTDNQFLLLCPKAGHTAGQYAIINAGVFDYSSYSSYGGDYQHPIAFIRSADNVPFVGNITGKIGAIFNGQQKLRCYDWDNKIILTFAATMDGTRTTDLIAGDTGRVTLTFSHSMFNEFYVAPMGNSPTNTRDLHDGLSPESAVSTFGGLIRAMQKSGSSGYPLKIHVIGASPITIDTTQIKDALGSCLIDIEGNEMSNVTVNVTHTYQSDQGIIIHNMNKAIVSVSSAFNSGILYVYDILETLELHGTGTSATLLSMLQAECLSPSHSVGGITASSISAKSTYLKSVGSITYDATDFNSGSDIRLIADIVKFNNKMSAITTSSMIGSLYIHAPEAIVDLTKFPLRQSSVKVDCAISRGTINNKDMGTTLLIDGRRGFYTSDELSINSSGYVDIAVQNSNEADLSSGSPTGLIINAERLSLSENGSTTGKIKLPNMHCNFNIREKIVTNCNYVAIDYGVKRNTEDEPELVGAVYNDGSSIVTPRIESPVALMNDAVIALLNGDYVVDVGMLDVCLELQSNDLYHTTTGNLVDVNASLNIGRIAKHGYIRGYHKYDSEYTDPIKFNIIANVGIVEIDSPWYSYFNDGTASEADNDPAKYTNFKFIAHVMYEGVSSVNQSYTGANALWQVVCDDKPKVILPPAPVSNGDYTLACTVTNGVVSYRWAAIGYNN